MGDRESGGWKPSRPRASFLLRCRHLARASVPAVVWLGAVLGVVWLGTVIPGPGQMTGIVDAARSTVSAPVDGRIAALLVVLHQEVEPGQVIARLDDADVRLQLSEATYELESLRADMAREAADLEQQARSATAEHGLDTGVEQRRLISAVEAAQLGGLSIRAQLEETRVRVQGATVEAERLASLALQGIGAEPELVRVRTERDALHKRITELEALYAEHRLRTETAQQRVHEFAPAGVSSLPVELAIAPMRWRLKEQEAKLERIALAAQLLLLKSPIRGRVASVTSQSGEWAAAGTALVSIVDPTPRRILAYVAASMRTQLEPRQTVRVSRSDGVLGTSTIESISPSVVSLPERLWRDPRLEEWGYEVVVAATGMELPGERVHLTLAR